MDTTSAGKAIAEASKGQPFSQFEIDTFSLDTAVQLRVRVVGRQDCLNKARLLHSTFEALVLRLEQGSLSDRQAVLDVHDTIRRLRLALNYGKRF